MRLYWRSIATTSALVVAIDLQYNLIVITEIVTLRNVYANYYSLLGSTFKREILGGISSFLVSMCILTEVQFYYTNQTDILTENPAILSIAGIDTKVSFLATALGKLQICDPDVYSWRFRFYTNGPNSWSANNSGAWYGRKSVFKLRIGSEVGYFMAHSTWIYSCARHSGGNNSCIYI
jgi:hypothetical protein